MSGYTKGHNAIFYHFAHDMELLGVALSIVRMGDEKRWKPFQASQGYLADRFRVKRPVIVKVLKALVEMGVVEIVSPGERRVAQVLRVNEATGDMAESSINHSAKHSAKTIAMQPSAISESSPSTPPSTPQKEQTPDPKPQTPENNKEVSLRLVTDPPPAPPDPKPKPRPAPKAARKSEASPVDAVLDTWQALKKARAELGKPKAIGMTGRRASARSSTVAALRRCLKHGETVDDCRLVLEWAFYADDSHAKFLRGERDPDQRPNEFMTISNLFAYGNDGEKFGTKLEKAQKWESAGRPGHPESTTEAPHTGPREWQPPAYEPIPPIWERMAAAGEA